MSPEVSLVLVSYEMAREIARTLRSLAPSYQRGLGSRSYEIILVDNGSADPPRPEAFADLGVPLAIHRHADPGPSPVGAANFGLSQARAPLIGVWIDGARMASPGLVGACLEAARLHPRPVIATGNYHLGPAPQYVSIEAGYDRAEEDRLLQSIEWPRDGYRLFAIATPELGRADGPMLESNALFMPRDLWSDLGGYDPAFAGPAGGAANPDVFIRACETEGTQLIRIAGEATFHQIHGGHVSNAPDRAMFAMQTASREYYRIRRRPLAPVRAPGWRFDAATGTVTK